MEWREVTDQKIWDKFIAGQDHAQFLQSWAWGEFQTAVGRRVFRLGGFEDNKMLRAGQWLEHYLGLGWAYLYCPRGPVSSTEKMDWSWPELIKILKTKTSAYGNLFLRLEPVGANLAPNTDLPLCRVHSVQPTHTLLLDLSQPLEKILAEMHQKTRYNIRLAEKKELTVEIKNETEKISSAYFKKMWQLFLTTAKRDGIKLHSKKYYQKMLTIMPSLTPVIKMGEEWLAIGIFIGFGDTFTYVHGASANSHRELMAPYLLHWQMIQLAKKHGYHYYDFGGLNPDDKTDFDFQPRWEGLTRFKQGFGGLKYSYPGAFDLPINQLGYKLYNTLKKIL